MEIVDLTSTQLKHVSRRAAAADVVVVVVVVYVVDFFKSTQKRFFVSVKTRADSDHFFLSVLHKNCTYLDFTRSQGHKQMLQLSK